MKKTYLDYAATSPVDEEALRCYVETAKESFGNPSSLHYAGYDAERLLRKAREGVLKVTSTEATHAVVFTSGATEANNVFIHGVASRFLNRGKRLITSKGEHPSVLNVFKSLEKEGYEVVYLPLENDGRVSGEKLSSALDDKTILVSLMGVNNETGAVNDLAAFARIVSAYPKCFFHSDLTQALGKLEVPFPLLDAFSFSGHKLGSTKGSGALVYRKKIDLPSLLQGGEQEGGVRPGTVDVPGALSMSLVLSKAMACLWENREKVAVLQGKIRSYILSRPEEFVVNSPVGVSPYIFNFSLLRKKASVYVECLSNLGVAVSSVSACSSKKENLSYVVLAQTGDLERAKNAVRVSFSPLSTTEDVDSFVAASEEALKGLVNRK